MSDLICLGKIVAVHGIKGEVKVQSFTADPKNICTYDQLSNKDKSQFFKLKFVGFAKQLLRVKIEGVLDRNAAEKLVGTELFVPRHILPKLKENTFYQADLIGLDVVDTQNMVAVGKVVGIYNFGAGDIVEIKFNNLKQTEMLPFNDDYVAEVDIKQKRLVLHQTSMSFFEDGNAANEG